MFLVGLSGAGKSSAGKAAAARAGLPFIDLDDEVARTAGRTIAEIFADSGEQTFREMETAATQSALSGTPAIIATGAGWIASARNRALLRSRERIIYLKVGADVAAGRIGTSQERPRLAGGATIEEILRQMEVERAPFYEMADDTLNTEGLTLQQVTVKLADLFKVIQEDN